MADSVDRVFVHALNTVKKVPKTGAMRPPSTERLRLYGLYKQAMEGDVDGVMERPASVGSNQDEPEDTRKDRQKYDSWDAQRGLSRTEAKRRYVEALIETMHRYASTTADARALVDELEFVWDQIKNNSVSSNGSSPRRVASGMEVPDYCTPRHSRYPPPNAGENMRVLSPESHEDEIERKGERRIWYSEQSEGIYGGDKNDKGRDTIEWRRKVEQALMKMKAEVAALREQTSNVWDHQGKKTKRKNLTNWLAWLWWVAVRHIFVDVVILGILLLWIRTRKDRRLQNLVREGLKFGLEFVRQIMPSR